MPLSKPIVAKSDKQARGKRPTLPRFNNTFFADLFDAKDGLATTFRWSRAIACPCRLNEDTDQHDPNCALCGGDGWWYRNPELDIEKAPAFERDYLEVNAVFSSASVSPDMFQQFGTWGFGDATLTVPGVSRVGFRDRFKAMQQEMPWTELLLRNTASNAVPIGKSMRTTSVQRTAMRYEPTRIEVVATTTDEFREGYDFILSQETQDEPRKLTWLPGMGPANGERYTVHYVCRPVWIVDKATYAIQNSRGPDAGILGKNNLQFLPTTVGIKLDYLTFAEGT